MKLLTVTIPAYNVEKTLSQTLESLCVEEAVGRLDIIVVDDGSKDSTAAVAREFERKYPGSVRLIQKENGGHGSTINVGIEKAEGLYFKVVDGDDRLTKDGLLALLSQLEQGGADLVASNYRKVPQGAFEGEDMQFTGIEYGHLYGFEELPVDGSVYFGIHSSTFRTELLKANAVNIQEHTFYVDTEYALLPMPYVDNVVFIDACVYLYTVGSAQQSIDTANFVKRYDDHDRVVKRLTAFALECAAKNISKPRLDYIYSVLGKLCFTHYMLSAYYDTDIKRGRARTRAFDAWLKGTDSRLYASLTSSVFIRFARSTNFSILPRGTVLKKGARKVFGAVKRLTGRRKLTY